MPTLGLASGPSGPSTGTVLPPQVVLCSFWGKASLRRGGGKGGGLGSPWQWWPLTGDNFATVKSMFSVVPRHFGGRLHLAVVAGSWTSSKGVQQSRKPWLHLLEEKTQLCLGRSFSAHFCAWAAPQAAAGQWLMVPPAATIPPGCWSPASGASSPPLRAFGWDVSLLGSISPCLFPYSVTFPCPSGEF